MKRIDVMVTRRSLVDGEIIQDLAGGIVMFGDKLVVAEAAPDDMMLMESLLTTEFRIPDSKNTISGESDPDLWWEWAPQRLGSGQALRFTDAYEDDDSMYDKHNGKFIGDENEKPL